MSLVTSKVCIVGDFAVGKTSVVERFVRNQFSEKYLTTVGVKVDTKEIELQDPEVTHKLVIWDVAGADHFGATEFAYLRGASGYIFVADGTRSATLTAAEGLQQQISDKYGVLPSVLLVNKSDLTGQWEVDVKRVRQLEDNHEHVYLTSAKTGEHVETALLELSNLIIRHDLNKK